MTNGSYNSFGTGWWQLLDCCFPGRGRELHPDRKIKKSHQLSGMALDFIRCVMIACQNKQVNMVTGSLGINLPGISYGHSIVFTTMHQQNRTANLPDRVSWCDIGEATADSEFDKTQHESTQREIRDVPGG